MKFKEVDNHIGIIFRHKFLSKIESMILENYDPITDMICDGETEFSKLISKMSITTLDLRSARKII